MRTPRRRLVAVGIVLLLLGLLAWRVADATGPGGAPLATPALVRTLIPAQIPTPTGLAAVTSPGSQLAQCYPTGWTVTAIPGGIKASAGMTGDVETFITIEQLVVPGDPRQATRKAFADQASAFAKSGIKYTVTDVRLGNNVAGSLFKIFLRSPDSRQFEGLITFAEIDGKPYRISGQTEVVHDGPFERIYRAVLGCTRVMPAASPR